VAGSWVSDGSIIWAPYPGKSRMIKDVIMREISLQGHGL
jgi:hypothetical protein